MNTFFEMKNLNDIKDAQFLTIYADKAENSSHRETFAMFLTYFLELMECLKTKFFWYFKARLNKRSRHYGFNEKVFRR